MERLTYEMRFTEVLIFLIGLLCVWGAMSQWQIVADLLSNLYSIIFEKPIDIKFSRNAINSLAYCQNFNGFL